MQLSEHFTLDEFQKSETARSMGVDNIIPEKYLGNAKRLALLMETVRELLGAPIHVNSAYRSVEVNSAVGGVPSSEHCTASACDFTCPAFGSPYDICQRIIHSTVEYGQLIYEGAWVHISLDDKFYRKQLTLKNGHYLSGIVK